MKKFVIGIFAAGCLLALCSLYSISAGAAEADANLAGLLESTIAQGVSGNQCTNTCTDYSVYWKDSCPAGERCIAFKNSCADDITLSYQIGCNWDGNPGAPQCDCTEGATLAKNGVKYWQIVNGDYASCNPSWQPDCLTEGFSIVANKGSGADCTQGTRVEFAAGNSGNPYTKFDSYNISTQGKAGGNWYSVPVVFKPDPSVTDIYDSSKLNCRPLYCNSLECPDAYLDSTGGGCSDNRSPQGNCQPTFSNSSGYLVEFCPSNCTESSCPSCQKNSSMNLATADFNGATVSEASSTTSANESSVPANAMIRNGLVRVTAEGLIYYALEALDGEWRHLPGYLAQIAAADINGDYIDEIFGLTDRGEIFYTNDLLPNWQLVPGVLSQIAACDLNGDGIADLVGVASDGHIYYTVDKVNWQTMPGVLNQLTCGDLDGDGFDDIAGVTSTDDIYYTLDNANWQHLPGKLSRLASGHINGDSKADLVGLTSVGQVYYTSDLINWISIPGVLSQIAVGHLNSDLQGDLVGLSSTGDLFYTSDLINWNQLPGQF